ncbi:50S ribosomal protein L18 [Bradymonadaceae bacterium TMQ3]|uniref:Large ribosomal subunit protein uL18 n=1 Tax=Lujinxingia sediminis TaxID=2480984 RepID=A0ABY0CQE3_9DELT|nr:50S ribosomal protein L18 [Lujinxingia sediminis]RDV38066.1 50S ribosomal protein L18 [Bradymonadaceae bacterium TMQ3]RVU42265.1 50S ribosomal protein L18 [Lujinxingia sediminis]TXC75736.1 50S ribosomal protein L18 [Bradymonadales bacterium TMQ1]
MLSKSDKASNRLRRKRRIRKKITGTAERPRLTVFRSNSGIYAQLVDDIDGRTLAAAGSNDKEKRSELAELDKTAQAKEVGKLLAARALEKGIDQVVFDRNGFIYHGRVAAVAEGAREAGLQF